MSKAKKESEKDKNLKPKKTFTPEEEEKIIEKAIRKPSKTFKWKDCTIFEKIACVSSFVALAVAIVFLVFEFIESSASWPYAWFDVAIGFAFLGESVVYRRPNRSLSIITLICAAIFLALGILKVFGVIAA